LAFSIFTNFSKLDWLIMHHSIIKIETEEDLAKWKEERRAKYPRFLEKSEEATQSKPKQANKTKNKSKNKFKSKSKNHQSPNPISHKSALTLYQKASR